MVNHSHCICFTLLKFERSGFRLAVLQGFISLQAVARYLLAIGHCLCFAFCGQSRLVPDYFGKACCAYQSGKKDKRKSISRPCVARSALFAKRVQGVRLAPELRQFILRLFTDSVLTFYGCYPLTNGGEGSARMSPMWESYLESAA